MTNLQLERAIAYTNNPTLHDSVNPDCVGGPVSLANNRCFVRAISAKPPVPGESWKITRAAVVAELIALGHDPDDHQAELDQYFPLGCRCASGQCEVPVMEGVANG
jgi:hypothetical protein